MSARLGEISDTGDADGEVLDTRPVDVTLQQVLSVLESFLGEYDQVPPMYSALKVNGQPLYKLARQGIEVERKPRRVSAYDIRFAGLGDNQLSFEVDCSSGFYVRSLVEDIGEKLGCGAHVTSLRRTRIAQLELRDAMTLADFEACESIEARIARLIPADSLLVTFPRVELDAQGSADLKQGRLVSAEVSGEFQDDARWVRIYGPDMEFIGLGQINASGQLAPKRLFI